MVATYVHTIKNVVASCIQGYSQCCCWEVLKNFNSPLPSKSNFVVVVVVILITVTVHVHTCILTNLTRLRDVYELGWLEHHITAACIVSYPDWLKGGLGWILLHALTVYVSISAHFFTPNPKLRGHVIVA